MVTRYPETERSHSIPLQAMVPAVSESLLQTINQAQETIYSYFLSLVRTQPPETVIHIFQTLFLQGEARDNPNILPCFYHIILNNLELEFRPLLRRCCYILINHWEHHRQSQYHGALLQVFSHPLIHQPTSSQILGCLRGWLINFIHSQDFAELKVFITRHQKALPDSWQDQFQAYLLVNQALDQHNSIDQRKAALQAATRLKQQFKQNLALYTSRCQSADQPAPTSENPTRLGADVLHLIKIIVSSNGFFNHGDMARIFLKQTRSLRYQDLKASLPSYLLFSLQNSKELIQVLKRRLVEKLNCCEVTHDQERCGETLLRITCEQIIDLLTTENGQEPSSIFYILLSRKNYLTLSILLLKLTLLCPGCHGYLEARIASLITYFGGFSEAEREAFVMFLGIYQVVSTIFSEDVEYNLVSMQPTTRHHTPSAPFLDQCRVFPRIRRSQCFA